MALEKVALGRTAVLTLVAFGSGTRLVTTGGVLSSTVKSTSTQ